MYMYIVKNEKIYIGTHTGNRKKKSIAHKWWNVLKSTNNTFQKLVIKPLEYKYTFLLQM